MHWRACGPRWIWGEEQVDVRMKRSTASRKLKAAVKTAGYTVYQRVEKCVEAGHTIHVPGYFGYAVLEFQSQEGNCSPAFPAAPRPRPPVW